MWAQEREKGGIPGWVGRVGGRPCGEFPFPARVPYAAPGSSWDQREKPSSGPAGLVSGHLPLHLSTDLIGWLGLLPLPSSTGGLLARSSASLPVTLSDDFFAFFNGLCPGQF